MVRGNAFCVACLAALLSGCESMNKKPEPPPEKPAAAEAPPLLEPTPATPRASETVAAPAPAPTAPDEPAPEPIVGDQEPLPKESYAPRQAQASRVHVVQRGETLRGLAKRYYKDPNKWRRIYEANRQRIANPNDIRVGMKLIIP